MTDGCPCLWYVILVSTPGWCCIQGSQNGKHLWWFWWCSVWKKNVSTSGFIWTLWRLWKIPRPFLSHSSIPPSFFIQYHMENFSSPQSKARKKNTHLDSSTAAVVIDRDVAVFILKCWTKQIAINLVQTGRQWPQRKQGRAEWKLYGSNNVNCSFGWFQGPSRIRLTSKPVKGDFIHLP